MINIKIFTKKNLLFILIIIIIHAIYFTIAVNYKNIYNQDSTEYLQQANNIKESGTFYAYYIDKPYDKSFLTLRPPIYGLFILLIKLIVNSDIAILFVQNILSIISLFYLFKLLIGFGITKHLKWLIILSIILYPSQLIVTNSIWSDTLFQFVFFFGFYNMILFFKYQKLKNWTFYNILLVIAIFIKPVLLYFWIINLIFSIFIFFKIKKPLIVLLALLLPLSIAGWSYTNYIKTGYYHFSSIKSFNLLKYNTYKLLVEKEGEEFADKFVNNTNTEANKMPDYKKKQEYIINNCKTILKENVFIYGYLHVRGMINYFLDPGRENIVEFFPLSKTKKISFFNEYRQKGFNGIIYYLKNINLWVLIPMILIFIWNIIVLSISVLFLFYKKINPFIRIGILIIIIYFSFVSGVVGCARYKMSIYFILIFTLPFVIKMIKKEKPSRELGIKNT